MVYYFNPLGGRSSSCFPSLYFGFFKLYGITFVMNI